MNKFQIALYRGTNDTQEFWESEDHSLLILRVKTQRAWSIHQNHRFRGFATSAEAAASQIGCTLSREREWVRNAGFFQLVEA